MRILPATSADAREICDLLKLSIAALCVDDHQNDPDILAVWAGTKTTELVQGWIEKKDGLFLVAKEDGRILSVASMSGDGMITLNYIHPDARFRGISRAIVCELESWARRQGINVFYLHSTLTAHRFYLSAGYKEVERLTGSFGNQVVLMQKEG